MTSQRNHFYLRMRNKDGGALFDNEVIDVIKTLYGLFGKGYCNFLHKVFRSTSENHMEYAELTIVSYGLNPTDQNTRWVYHYFTDKIYFYSETDMIITKLTLT